MPTNFKNDEILLQAFAPGGTSAYPDSLYLDAAFAGVFIPSCGAGQYSPVELGKLLAGKNLSLRPFIQERWQGMEGSSTPGDLETFLQLLYLQFTAPRRDTTLFRNAISGTRDMLANLGSDPVLCWQTAPTVSWGATITVPCR